MGNNQWIIQSEDRHGSETVTPEDSEIIHGGGNKTKSKRKKYGNQGKKFFKGTQEENQPGQSIVF